ncbi:MAG: DUF5329 family protein [Planctomycetota bacterium]
MTRAPVRGLLLSVLLVSGCSKDGDRPPASIPPGPVPATAPGVAPPGTKAVSPDAPKPPAAALTEREKIDRLLAAIESADVVFIRNGSEHGPKAAASHLRGKLSSAGDRVKTARDFIEHLASRSSFSGKPYLIRTKDGAQIPSREWLLKALANIEASETPGPR